MPGLLANSRFRIVSILTGFKSKWTINLLMDVILTGIPRSGTTLACSLLNRLPQSIALHEPMNPSDLIGLMYPGEFLQGVEAFFRRQRSSLIATGRAVSKVRGGKVPDNPFGTVVDQNGLRPSTIETQQVYFNKRLCDGFRLVVKHPNCFTATLDALCIRYSCFAVVRNPLAVLLSWHSISAPVNDGRIPFGEAFDPILRHALDVESDRLSRQIVILRWYFSAYASYLRPEHVIRYEDLVASRGRTLRIIDPDADLLAEHLVSRNANCLYDATLVGVLAERLLSDDSVYAGFYTRDDIASLRSSWELSKTAADARVVD